MARSLAVDHPILLACFFASRPAALVPGASPAACLALRAPGNSGSRSRALAALIPPSRHRLISPARFRLHRPFARPSNRSRAADGRSR